MGEYATLKSSGERVKIGTCESMFYLRADQATQVRAEHGNVDPRNDTEFLLYRFPWPQEDGIAPGYFDYPAPNVSLHDVRPPADFDHGHKQWRADGGYLLLTPCPESDHGAELLGLVSTVDKVQHNGYPGAVKISAQRVWGDLLVLVCECNGCGHAYRLPTLADVEPVLVSLRSRGDREGEDRRGWWHEIADRIAAGYEPAAALRLGLKANEIANEPAVS